MGAKRNPKPKHRPPRGGRQQELPLNTQPTLAELVTWYREKSGLWPRLRPGSQRTRGSHLRLAVESLSAHPTTGEITAWLAAQVECGKWSRTTANQVRKTLYFLYRVSRDLYAPTLLNVVAGVPAFEVPLEAPRCLPDPERTLERLLAACTDEREQGFVAVAFELGLRRGELLGLEPKHLDLKDLDRAFLAVRQQRSADSAEPSELKTASSCATLPISRELAERLRRLLKRRLSTGRAARGEAARRYLFPYFKHDVEDLIRRLRAAVPEAFPPGRAWHAFRHTVATDLVERGWRVEEVQNVLRHKNYAYTAAYVRSIRGHEVPEEKLRARYADRAREKQHATLKPIVGDGKTVSQSNQQKTRRNA
jgi:integrase